MTTRRQFLGSALAAGSLLALPGTVRAAAGVAGHAADGAMAGAGSEGGPGGHVLAPLPYAYEALEPHIDAQTMQIHHGKHHQAYVNGLNAAEEALAEARSRGAFDDMEKLERLVAFHGSGHYNHTVFWRNMKPAGEARPEPDADLLRAIERDFGGLAALKAQFSAAAARVEGNGWGVLVWHPGFGRLLTLAFMNQQNSALTGAIPLLMCDVWEHAYYLRYQNRRADYIAAWWNVVDWANVSERFRAARSLAL